jgi:hypothetical protein
MALAWMKPLEQGFDVRLTAAIHGGCIRLLTTHASGITGVAGLKGKTVGTVSMASPDKNFISILAIKQNVDPVKDIEWRAYPADLLGAALQKGEFAGFTKVATADQLAPMLRSHTHHHHPVDGDLKREIALYAQELKQASVFKSSTDAAQFADRVCVDILST